MFGRRQIREKVVAKVYSQYQNPISEEILEKNFFSEIDKIYHLYIYQLNFLVALKEVAEGNIEIRKNRFLKSDEDVNPNQKFVSNQILKMIEENEARIHFTQKHNELSWDLNDELLLKTFQKIKSGKRYLDFMQEKDYSFEEDQKFVGKLFLRYIAENQSFQDYIEEKELSWSDDLHISNSMIQKTIGFFKENGDNSTLIKMIKDKEDENFAKKLLRQTITYWEQNEKKLEVRLENWDMERISTMDKVILITAISELDFFPQTPSRVIINEYIEISKTYSTDKSNIFVNGILDKYIKETNRIN